jgi:hypothetical protein
MTDSTNKPIVEPPSGEGSKPLRRQARAELVWDGNYDANGKRVVPLRVALPFQTVETVNESAQERQRGFLFDSPAHHLKEWRNRLIWGLKICPAFAVGRVRGNGESHLHRPAV